MTQNYTDNCFAGTHVAQTDMQNIENNFLCLKSTFAGSAAPSNLVAGMQWFDTDTDQLYIRNADNDAWLAGGDFAPGTVVMFGQASAPLGWTKKTTWADNAMLCINTQANGTALGSGGSANPQSVHTHTYTETSGHVHQWYDYSGPYTIAKTYDASGSPISLINTGLTIGVYIYAAELEYNPGGIGVDCYTGKGYSSGTTGNNTLPLYQEIIACTKD